MPALLGPEPPEALLPPKKKDEPVLFPTETAFGGNTFSLTDQLASRIRLFPPRARTTHPVLVGALVSTTSLPDYVVRGLASRFDEFVGWIDARDSVAGVPGFLRRIRRAGDEQATEFMERVQGLSPQDQATMFYLMGIESPEEREVALRTLLAHVTPESALGRAWDEVASILGKVKEYGERVGAGFAPFGSGEPSTRPFDPFGTITPAEPRIVDTEEGFKVERPRTGGERVFAGAVSGLEAAFAKFVLPLEIGGDIAGRLLRAAPGPVGTATTAIADVAGTTVRGSLDAVARVGDPVVRNALALFGVRPGDAAYDEAYTFGQFVFGAIALHSVGRVAHGIKTTRTQPAEFAQARLRLTGAPADYLRHPISRVVYDLFNRSWDEWLDTRPGRRFTGHLQRLAARAEREGQSVVGLIQETYGMKVPVALARDLEGAKPADVPRLLRNAQLRAGEAEIEGLLVRVKELQAQLARPRDVGKPLAEQRHDILLRGELLVVQHQIGRAAAMLPIFRFPKRNRIRSALREPASRIEEVMHFLLNPRDVNPSALSKLVDEIPTYPKIWSPIDTARPRDWREQNASTISTWLRRNGLPQQQITRIVGAKYETGEAFHDWLRDIGTTLDAHLAARGVPADLRYRITRFWDKEETARTRSVLTTEDGFQSYVLRRDNGSPLPSMPTEFAQSITLPSIEYAIEATSWIRRLARDARKVGVGKANLGLLFDLPILVARLLTSIQKPFVLITRPLATPLRIQGEQFARGYFHEDHIVFNLPGGGRVKAAKANPRLRRDYPPPEPGALGDIVTELFDIDQGRVDLVATPMRRYNEGARPAREHFTSAESTLSQLHSDRLIKEFLRRDLDVDAMLAWLQKSEWGRAFVQTHLSKTLAESTLRNLPLDQALRAVLNERRTFLLQQTRGDPELLNLIASGKMRAGDIRVPRTTQGEPITERYAAVRKDLRAIEENLRTLDRVDDASTIAALRDSRRRLWEEMKRLERQATDAGVDLAATTGRGRFAALRNRGQVASELQRRFNENRYDFPDHMAVEVRRVSPRYDENVARVLQLERNAVSQSLYRGVGTILSKFDVTRRSLYYTLFAKNERALRKQGWSKDDARELAGMRAAEEVRDIMYDLRGRTSVQRALRDVFWFLPAWQEVLYTWFVRLPSQYHWPVGAVLIPAKVGLLLDIGRSVGWVQRHADGEVLVIPGAERALEAIGNKLLGGQVNVPPITVAKVSGFNTVTSAGGLPGVSSAAGFVLGKAALKYGGIYKDLSDLLQPFGPETPFLPTGFTYWWEFFTGEVPPFELFSRDHQQRMLDRTYNDGLRFAYSDLYKAGVRPPDPKEYPSDDEWREASAAYLERLLSEGEEYARGMFMVRAIGSTVLPASLSSTSDEQQMWERFWRNKILPLFGEEGSGFNQEQRDRIEAYLEEHPYSLAFSTFSTVMGETERALPFPETEDDAIYDRLYRGEVREATPAEFAQTVAATESFRTYTAQLASCLARIGTTASEQLRAGYSRAECVDEYKTAFDRYLFLNPDVDAAYRKSRLLFAEKYGIPVRSFAAERLADDFTDFRIIARGIVNDAGARPAAVREALAEIGQRYAETFEEGGARPPLDKVERRRNWYMENIIGPYYDRVAPLYEKAEALEAAGAYTGDTWDKVRRINESYVGADFLTRGGEAFPTPEEFAYGNLSEAEQQVAVHKWATRPPSWLSTFQREKVGYEGLWFEGADEMLRAVEAQDTRFYDYVDKQDVSPSSNYYDVLVRWNEQQKQKIAKQYGTEGEQLYALQEAAPYERLNLVLFGTRPEGRTGRDYITANYGERASVLWRQVSAAADFITNYLESKDLSPRGYSEAALYYKTWFYDSLTKARAKERNAGFDDLLRDLGFAFPGDGRDYREGALLYNALFFDDFKTEHIPDDLIAAGGY